ncbi:uncharacterized protein [Dermacentor andersoni]|uniref:uncharacterized protein n=1 Tax=Dermacentor andersoni TaxID=34620 RepID=UPI0021552932|nr:uncharacterized protein LOC126517636 [Dermacentor andersoni]
MLLIVGDFNAPHAEWGYPSESCGRKGTNVWDTAQTLVLTLLLDPERPTRFGNSITKDSFPDLTFARNIPDARWQNLGMNIGSDHYVLSTTFTATHSKGPRRTFKHTNWDAFRYVRAQRPQSPIDDLDTWTDTLLRDAANATSTVTQEEGGPTPDAKLMHMWEAQRSLHARWLRRKHNRPLKLRLARLERDIEAYSTKLSQEQWHQTCDRLDGQLGCKNTWFLLKHLLDPTHTKSAPHKNPNRIIHAFPGANQELLATLTDKYINTSTDIPTPFNYKGCQNPDMDRDIMAPEVRTALNRIKTTAAAGDDHITIKMLRNLDDQSVAAFSDLFNHHWHEGRLSGSWKHAKLIFIPKPGK